MILILPTLGKKIALVAEMAGLLQSVPQWNEVEMKTPYRALCCRLSFNSYPAQNKFVFKWKWNPATREVFPVMVKNYQQIDTPSFVGSKMCETSAWPLILGTGTKERIIHGCDDIIDTSSHSYYFQFNLYRQVTYGTQLTEVLGGSHSVVFREVQAECPRVKKSIYW